MGVGGEFADSTAPQGCDVLCLLLQKTGQTLQSDRHRVYAAHDGVGTLLSIRNMSG